MQNWPAPSVKEPKSPDDDLARLLAQRAGKNEDGIGAAHLRKAGNWLGTLCGQIHQGAAAVARAGEADSLDERVQHQRLPDGESLIVEHGENALRRAGGANGVDDDARDDLAGAGMCGMGFDDDGVAGGKRGGSISASDGIGEREIAGAEHGDGAERLHHGADVGARQRLAIGQSRVDAGADPGALLDHIREHAALAAGAFGFALQARFRQRGFLLRAGDDLGHRRVEAIGDGAQQTSALAGGALAPDEECFLGGAGCTVNVLLGCREKGRIDG